MNEVKGRVSTKECSVCNHIFPVTNMIKRMENVYVGKSGISASTNIANIKGSTRVNSGRAYTRRKQIWYCKECFQGPEALTYKGQPLLDIKNSPFKRFLNFFGLGALAKPLVVIFFLSIATFAFLQFEEFRAHKFDRPSMIDNISEFLN